MQWAIALESSGVGEWMRSSGWAYPAVNLLHVAGLILLVGSMLLLDLRLLGTGRSAISLPAATSLLTPFAVAGLFLMLTSGFLLFAADAAPLLDNPLFLPKLALIALGIANALLFRALWRSAVEAAPGVLPGAARLQAVASLAIWVAAAALGRLLAYV